MRTKDGKCSALFYLVYSLPTIGGLLMIALLGYVSYFAINVLGLSSLLVGNLLLVSKIFDGFTDIVGGFLIDHTRTRWGKARPYDWAYVGFCLSAVLLFSIPKMGTVAMAICLFVTYTLIYSVFQTLYSCANAVYLSRTVEDPKQQVSINIFSMFLGIIGAVVAGIFIPVYLESIGTDAEAWRTFAIMLGVPSAIISGIRFFIIKENDTLEEAGVQTKINFKEGVHLLAQNKYVLILALALLAVNITSNMVSVNPFYFEEVVGSLSQQSVVNAISAIAPLSVVIYPALANKVGKKRLCVAALILGVIGKLLPLIALDNIPLLAIANALGTVGYMPIFVLTVNMIIECMDYGEWKSHKRGEGIYSCISGFCSKVGTGIGVWIVGFGMSLGGYVSEAATQSTMAVNSVIGLYTIVPAVFYLIAIIAMHFYKLDDELPQIREELNARRSAQK